MSRSNDNRFICLAVLTVLGDILLTFKFTNNSTNDIVGVLCAFALGLVTVLLFKYLAELWEKSSFKFKETLSFVLTIIISLFVLIVAVFTLGVFSDYASSVMLLAKDIFLPFVSLSLLALFLALGGKNVILKLSLLTLPAVLVIILLMFAFSVQFMSVKYLLPYRQAGRGVWDAFCPLYLNLMSSAVPLLVFGRKNKNKSFAISYLISFVIIGVCIVNVLGMFGSELASTLKYPYSVAVSTASMGEIFSRLDGFFYATCFFTVLIKTGLCIYTVKELLEKLINKIKP